MAEKLPNAVVLLLLLYFGGCATANSPQRQAESANAQVASLEGVWDGQRQLRYWNEGLRLIVGQEGAWLEVISRVNAGFVKLFPTHMEKTGVVFTFSPQKNEGGKNQRLVPSLATGRVLATRYTDERGGGDRILLRFPQSDGRFGPAVILKQPHVPSLRPRKVFMERYPTSFAYRDWQSRENAREASPEQAQERLRKTLAQLEEQGGWTCLEQSTMTVRSDRLAVLKSPEMGIDRLYLIYCPSSDTGLTFSLSSNPPGYAVVHGQSHDYPLILSTRGTLFKSVTTIELKLLPTAPSLHTPPRSVQVTIFVLGSAPGDYGPGCDLE